MPQSSEPQVHSLQDLDRNLSPDFQQVIGHVEWPSPHALLSIVESVQTGKT